MTMKKTFYILTAALLLTGALLTTGCTNDDTANDNNTAKTVTFTVTLAPKGGATTRAITTGTEGGKEVLTTAWKSGEKIAIYYQKTNGDYDKATATVGTPNADGSAPITATLTDAKGGEAQFIYPATLKPDKAASAEEQLLSQHGNLMARTTPNASIDDISTNFDYVMGRGTLSVNAETAAVSSNVTMENKVCICKFHFDFDHNGLNIPVNENPSFVPIIINDGDGHTYTINCDKPDDSISAISGSYRGFRSTDDIYVAMLPIENKTVTFTATRKGGTDTYTCTKTNVTLEKGKFYRNLGTITMVKSNSVTLTSSTGELTLQNNDMLSGTGGANTRLKIADGATVMLNGVTNTGITQDANIPGIDCLGDATIIFAGTNSVRGREYAAGIFVPEGKTLTIMGSGTLNATGGNTSKTGAGSGLIGGAGIGGTKDVSCGNIVIKGGTITATGTGWSAGIGSGYAKQANTTCGAITITGGTVTATGSDFAAGIGSGKGYNDGSNIFVSACGAISITGGTVTATGGDYAVGIGSGSGNYNQDNHYVSACGAISITGGTVTATSGDDGAGIGSGWFGRFASISIGSGITRVTAIRSNDFRNVPIGKGFEDRGSGAVTFGNEIMHNGNGDCKQQNWTHWPTDGQTYGGIRVAVTNDPFTNKTWTLTPAP